MCKLQKEDDEIFSKCVYEKKTFNKQKKLEEALAFQAKGKISFKVIENDEKKKKTEERMNKIVIKGRKVHAKTMIRRDEVKRIVSKNNEDENSNGLLDYIDNIEHEK